MSIVKNIVEMINRNKIVKMVPVEWNRYDRIFEAYSVSDLKGIGEEYLLDRDGNLIAIFVDGNFRRSNGSNSHSNDVTMSVA